MAESKIIHQSSIKLLWTNPNPTASFPPQTIPLDLSSYDMIMIISDTSTTMMSINGVAYIYGNLPALPRSRQINASINTVIFGSGYQVNTEDNGAAVPINIYGIKL